MSDPINHHYVPIWYQKRFLAPGRTSFKILDRYPERFHLPDGTFRSASSISNKGPKAFGFIPYLYSVDVLGKKNHDIEVFLFGEIDSMGKIAVDDFLSGEINKIHLSYRHLFEFMDAARLRTPKGLGWLKTVRQIKTHTEVLFEMQEARRLHCLMWMEGTLEILSAKESETKFIFTDHPVTFFNRHLFPTAQSGLPSEDPDLFHKGTQTIFPFDRDNLFVLTHIEGSRNLNKAGALSPRTNARFFDKSFFRLDKGIRGRLLNDAQVLEVNYIMKMRSHKYIAGNDEEDLYPEHRLKNRMWPKLGRFLFPPTDKVQSTSAEVFIVDKDNNFHHQDAFGRRPATEAQNQIKKIQADDVRKQMLVALAKSGIKL